MIEFESFTAELTALADALRQPIDAGTIAVYHELLAGELADVGEMHGLVCWAAKAGRWRFFPPVHELLDALREFRGAPPLEAEAAQAYERTVAASVYTAEGGASWTYRGVVEAAGKAAADAFLAAGGHHAFATTWDEAKRRERFLAAYVEAARDRPEGRLLPPAPEANLLPAPATDPSPLEAKQIVQRIADLARPAPLAPPIETQEQWDARRAELLRQADELLGGYEDHEDEEQSA